MRLEGRKISEEIGVQSRQEMTVVRTVAVLARGEAGTKLRVTLVPFLLKDSDIWQ